MTGLTKKVKKECCAQISVKRKKEDNQKFPKTLYKLEHLSVILFLSFLFLFILSYDNKQERAVMTNAAEILKSVQIGLNVVIFLLNTDRGLRATELCNECVILLQNLDSGSHLDISDVLFNAYEKALAIAIEIGDRRGEGTTYGNLGNVFHSLGEYQNAKEYHEKALAITIEIGDRREEGTTYGNLGSVFHSLDEFQNAKEYHEKALAIAIEIGDRGVEGTTDGKLGKVFDSFGEYQNA